MFSRFGTVAHAVILATVDNVQPHVDTIRSALVEAIASIQLLQGLDLTLILGLLAVGDVAKLIADLVIVRVAPSCYRGPF